MRGPLRAAARQPCCGSAPATSTSTPARPSQAPARPVAPAPSKRPPAADLRIARRSHLAATPAAHQRFTVRREAAAGVGPVQADAATAMVRLEEVDDGLGPRTATIAARDIKGDEEVAVVGEASCITRVDADAHPLVGPLAASRGEVVALALWLMAERAQGPSSQYAPLLSEMPATTLSPLLWSEEERQQLLQGTSVAAAASERAEALAAEWVALQGAAAEAGMQLPAGAFNERAFAAAVCVVLAAGVYLPSAQCLALVPGVSCLRRTGREGGCRADYDAERQAVVATAPIFIGEGSEVCLFDGRPNGELLLACGAVEQDSPSDYLLLNAELLQADKLYALKKQVVEELGYSVAEQFPVYADRFPTQLLSYLRLSRIADSAQLARVTFERDVVISELNEYEILQLIMGDCRERLQAFPAAGGGVDDDVKLLQDNSLDPKLRLSTQLALAEKRILRGTMDAVRTRLAPIRGIPTKSGTMQDPNSDLIEIFETIENLPKAPKKLLDGILGWARGDSDPTWKK